MQLTEVCEQGSLTNRIITLPTNGQWSPVASDNITTTGINIGSYAPNGNAYVKFKAKVTDNSKLEKCGVNTLINTATAETDDGNKSDTATVTVSKTCNETLEECIAPNGEKYPKGDEHCKPAEDCTTPGNENNAECVETPAELPKTGMSGSLVALIGTGSLVTAVSYYVTSRRNG